MTTPIKRNLSIGVNVKEAGNLPKVGRHLAAFLKTVDHDHGPFDVNIAVSVEPTDASAIGPIELPQGDEEMPQTIEIVYMDRGDVDPEGAD
jgi:hypothetical protein